VTANGNGNGPLLAATVRERNAGNASDWAAATATATATAFNAEDAEKAENAEKTALLGSNASDVTSFVARA